MNLNIVSEMTPTTFCKFSRNNYLNWAQTWGSVKYYTLHVRIYWTCWIGHWVAKNCVFCQRKMTVPFSCRLLIVWKLFDNTPVNFLSSYMTSLHNSVWYEWDTQHYWKCILKLKITSGSIWMHGTIKFISVSSLANAEKVLHLYDITFV